MKYRNRIPEPETTISGCADNKKRKKINPDQPTLDFFDSNRTYIFFWPYIKTSYQIWSDSIKRKKTSVKIWLVGWFYGA